MVQVKLTAGNVLLPGEQAGDIRTTFGKPKLIPPSPVQIGQVQPMAQQGVGAPAAPAMASGPTREGQTVQIPFSQFFAMTAGDKAKAEAAVPGITSAQGVHLLKPGPDGRPTVSVPLDILQQLQAPTPQQTSRQLIDAKFAEAAQLHRATAQIAHGAPKGKPQPDFVTADGFAQALGAKTFHELTPHTLAALLPGIESPNGRMHWVRTRTDGVDMLPNPLGPNFRKFQQDAPHGVEVAADE